MELANFASSWKSIFGATQTSSSALTMKSAPAAMPSRMRAATLPDFAVYVSQLNTGTTSPVRFASATIASAARTESAVAFPPCSFFK